jgi:putative aminopeptidase FrvX
MNVELLKELTEAHGVSGQESAIRDIVRRELGSVCELETDALGSLICVKRGSGSGPGKKLMIAAHMDEIGFLVKYIDRQGFLRLLPLGGWDPRQMNAQQVVVRTSTGLLPGVLMYETKPAHLLGEGEGKGAQKVETFFVDLGMTGEEAAEKVSVGDSVTMDRPFTRIGSMLTCKAMDDRVGVFVMIEAVKQAKSNQVDVYAVATVQEEIGLRGATAAGAAIAPDIAVALDVTLANDFPGIPESDQITVLGKGTAIKILDSSLICHPKVVAHFKRLAEAHSIPHQYEMLTRGGTDAGGIQRLHGGIPSFTLSVPARYVHTVNESVHAGDVAASIDLLVRYIEDAHTGDYAY